jgi:hypothetical protein
MTEAVRVINSAMSAMRTVWLLARNALAYTITYFILVWPVQKIWGFVSNPDVS